MKKYLTIMVLASSICLAQTVELSQTVSTDSIDLQSVVAKQMAVAIEKQLQDKLNPKPVDTYPAVETKKIESVVEKQKEKPAHAEMLPFLSMLSTIPWQYKIFALVSIVIMGFVFTRRIVLTITRSSKKALKKKIGLMREEKVGGSKNNPKLVKVRKTLKDNLDILKHNDRQVSRKAKQLNISKGELLLATRLKLYEVGKP